MPASESDRILAPGVPITLATGREVNLRFSLRSLKTLEDRFGSVAAMTAALNGILPLGGEEPANGKIIGTVVPVLAAGLSEEGITEDALLDGLLTWSELRGTYFDAIAAALDQAFPPPASASRPGKEAEVTTASNGVASTTPPPSSVAAMASSGG